MSKNGWNYDEIKREAKARRRGGLDCTVKDLIVLAPQNDPFYVGTATDLEMARWFAEVWKRFGYASGVHLRRVHYQLVSQDPPLLKPDGLAYGNTEKDWMYLALASKYARYLDMVDPGHFVDRRNPEAIINTEWRNFGHELYGSPTPRFSVEALENWEGYGLPDLPELEDLPSSLPEVPGLEVAGYFGTQQDYHLEVWVEKTTMNDVLEPLCRRYNVNLVTGAGELSITAVLDLVARVQRAKRPCRIFYVSDFDPAGYGMPVSVARKIEFFLRDRGLDLDIRLDPVALTKEQVVHHRLPRTPIKDTELRKGRFEDVHGEGAVELDALEALRPGALVWVVKWAILDYYDPELEQNTVAAYYAANEALEDEYDSILEEFDDELSELKAEYIEVQCAFSETRARFANLVADFQEEIDGHGQRLEVVKEQGRWLYSQIREKLEAADVELPDLATPDLPAEDNSKLYDSGRDYLTQLDYYKTYQRDGETA